MGIKDFEKVEQERVTNFFEILEKEVKLALEDIVVVHDRECSYYNNAIRSKEAPFILKEEKDGDLTYSLRLGGKVDTSFELLIER